MINAEIYRLKQGYNKGTNLQQWRCITFRSRRPTLGPHQSSSSVSITFTLKGNQEETPHLGVTFQIPYKATKA